jgi:hypothetical protein
MHSTRLAWPLVVALFSACFTQGTPAQTAAPSAPQAKAVMTDSTVAALAGSKRVVISSLVLSFQASIGDKTSSQGLFNHKVGTSVTLQMPDMDTALLGGMADEIYAQLRADLQEGGFEVLPEAELLANPSYQKILKLAGFSNFSKWGNLHGETLLVAPTALKPYMPYDMETGKFPRPAKFLIKDWFKGIIKASSTEGGPTGTLAASVYELPALEVAVAKELNAHLVKATYVVTLGASKASEERLGQNVELNGAVRAQTGLLPGQTRIAFRSLSASPKGESSSSSYAANFGENAPPSKDGDVVVALGDGLVGGTSYFSVDAEPVKGNTLLGGLISGFGMTGAAKQFVFTATIADPAAYRRDVMSLLRASQKELVTAVKR